MSQPSLAPGEQEAFDVLRRQHTAYREALAVLVGAVTYTAERYPAAGAELSAAVDAATRVLQRHAAPAQPAAPAGLAIMPVRYEPSVVPHVTNSGLRIAPGHPLDGQGCPACGGLLNTGPVSLVFIGREPGSGWTASAVAVHDACTGPGAWPEPGDMVDGRIVRDADDDRPDGAS